jgi:hypothetical protein
MSDALFGSPRSTIRRMAVTNVSIVWDHCKNEIERLMGLLDPHLQENARDYLGQSYTALKQVVAGLNADDYIFSEKPAVFEQLIKRLNDSIKKILLAYIIPNGITCRHDNVEDLSDAFFRAIERRLHKRRLCNYSSVTKLVRFVRNHEEHDHRNKPKDIISGKNSFGNVYTLSSIIVLSFFAYIEILRFWVEAEEASP